MIYFLLGFSISLNLFLIFLYIFIFKKIDVSEKLKNNLENVKELKEKKKDPFTFSV